MTSDAATVDEYLKGVPAERLDALEKIRTLIRETHPDYEESMQYGMPSYGKDGVIELSFASQRQNIALYLLKAGVVNSYRDQFPKSAIGKGCIRYRNPAKIDFDLMREMLEAHCASEEEAC
ncbi:MAG TPA: DUF1801 domain-containing protein [Spirochaetia bacterium]|nr:DUF1801 domain-containing protein [Spirochaetia bacterium]